jgi:hypothetical protein
MQWYQVVNRDREARDKESGLVIVGLGMCLFVVVVKIRLERGGPPARKSVGVCTERTRVEMEMEMRLQRCRAALRIGRGRGGRWERGRRFNVARCRCPLLTLCTTMKQWRISTESFTMTWRGYFGALASWCGAWGLPFIKVHRAGQGRRVWSVQCVPIRNPDTGGQPRPGTLSTRVTRGGNRAAAFTCPAELRCLSAFIRPLPRCPLHCIGILKPRSDNVLRIATTSIPI